MQTINHIVEVIPAHTLQVEVPEKKMVHTIVISPDPYSTCPREWDNLGTMYCWHRGYTLGDEQPKSVPQDKRIAMVCEFDPDFEERFEKQWVNCPARTPDERQHYQRWYTKTLDEAFEKYYVSLPLYLYEHSGITMRTGSFSCPWDSGQVGFIAVSKEKLRKEYGWKRITQERIQKVYEYLTGEVETYAQYLEGQVYDFCIYEHDLDDEPDEGEMLDSCGGFFGYPTDYKTNGMTDNWPADWETTHGVAVKHEGASYDWEIKHEVAK